MGNDEDRRPNVTERDCELTSARFDDSINRIDQRLTILESNTIEMHKLGLAIERLTITVANMVSEQSMQNTKITNLESRDGDMWRKVVRYTITTTIGLVLGLLINHGLH